MITIIRNISTDISAFIQQVAVGETWGNMQLGSPARIELGTLWFCVCIIDHWAIRTPSLKFSPKRPFKKQERLQKKSISAPEFVEQCAFLEEVLDETSISK